jgi:5-methyltetrahydrofolate--homocysteine methyltransferase
VASETALPVCIDSADPAALLAALRRHPEPASIVNSVTADEESLQEILPVVAEAGCYVIAMTKSRQGIPATAGERIALAETILETASKFGIGRERILVDCLTLPAATDSSSTEVTLDCITRLKEQLECPAVLGASNISFGMPERPAINSAFLSMAVRAGLRAAIINPLEPGLVLSLKAADFLAGKDKMGRAYLKYYRGRKE